MTGKNCQMCSVMLTALNIPFGPNLPTSGIGDEEAGVMVVICKCLENG